MKMLAVLRLVVAIAIATTFAVSANAQARGRQPSAGQVPRYAPQSPTVSPYINLLDRTGGPATNYYGLIRPIQRQQAVNSVQSQANAFQEQQLGQQAQQLNQIRDEQVNFGQPKSVKPTGTSGWFQNLGNQSPYLNQGNSHYYGQWQSGKGGRRR